ncbi:MAG: hypothetical protein K6T78_12265 [Alicyclobacillus sp.]|nr:hypothetical protein [Alicyclobacillus sp.]
MTDAASSIIRALGFTSSGGGSEVYSAFRIATIPSSYSGSGRPTLQFDGETSPTVRTYPYLSSYTPAAGDRVLVALVNHGGCILGKIM